MKSNELNNLLETHDLGDDWGEDDNRLFDRHFSDLVKAQAEASTAYANQKMDWYLRDTGKYYPLADCNRFHYMWLGYKQEWYTLHGIANPPIGRAYGYWEGKNHNWAWEVVGKKLVFNNWGNEIKPAGVVYDGKGSEAV